VGVLKTVKPLERTWHMEPHMRRRMVQELSRSLDRPVSSDGDQEWVEPRLAKDEVEYLIGMLQSTDVKFMHEDILGRLFFV